MVVFVCVVARTVALHAVHLVEFLKILSGFDFIKGTLTPKQSWWLEELRQILTQLTDNKFDSEDDVWIVGQIRDEDT